MAELLTELMCTIYLQYNLLGNAKTVLDLLLVFLYLTVLVLLVAAVFNKTQRDKLLFLVLFLLVVIVILSDL